MATSKNSCSHSRLVQREVKDHEWVDDDWVEVTRYEMVDEDTYVDVDLHRFRCTQCGHIRYYSSRARDYFENGVNEDNAHIGESLRESEARKGENQ